MQRWNLPDGLVISHRPAHPALVTEAAFAAAQDISAAHGPVPQDEPVIRRYLLAGLLACGVCQRRMESARTNGKPAYRRRHGRTSAIAPDPARPKNIYVREDKLFHVGYTVEGTSKLMRRHGWSAQVPVCQAIERDEEAVAVWKAEVWPDIKGRRATWAPSSASRTRQARG